ncbi:hypothetical protein ACIQ1H_09290 [Lysinibacillus sp. NPDC097279]|uniref:hypothetical protein n=1 Tax=Lysinibacillus sp. NPDC097279 TaxID=3364143 RepID=UPI00382DC316
MEPQYSFEDLFLKLSLYEPVKIDADSAEILDKLCGEERFHFDSYCIGCKKEAIFRVFENEFVHKGPSLDNTILGRLNYSHLPYKVALCCQRNPNHIYTYFFDVTDSILRKVGQYPSIADIEIHGIQKYQKLLKKDYKDFSKAIGLYSHGIGAGSYVYLRKIFENLIEEKHLEAQNEPNWDEEKYNQSRMKEKIALLEHKLPNILVETPELYGILSKGIHELNEEECLEYFSVTKNAIELILDEKLALLDKKTKMNELKRNLVTIATTISK